MSESTYTPSLPKDISIDPEIVAFFENFYAVSDDSAEATHEKYARYLTDDGTLIMGSKTGKGFDEILALRKGLWSGPVKTRHHHLERIYPFGNSSGSGGLELMLHGFVDYGLKNGKSLTVDWAARAVMVKAEGDGLKMKLYQVYLDSAPVVNAVKE